MTDRAQDLVAEFSKSGEIDFRPFLEQKLKKI